MTSPRLKTCSTCGSDFEFKSAKAMYCSSYCNHVAYRKRNPQKVRDRKNRWYAKDKDARAEYRQSMASYHREYWIKRRQNDVDFKLRNTLRNRLNGAIKGNRKSGSAVKDLGCSVGELKKYLESKFTKGMSWENHGEWHIDHIQPLVSFDLTDRKQFKEACHYTNLQPLWAEDNLRKGSNEQ